MKTSIALLDVDCKKSNRSNYMLPIEGGDRLDKSISEKYTATVFFDNELLDSPSLRFAIHYFHPYLDICSMIYIKDESCIELLSGAPF
jgi:hypothetical protein